MWIDVGAQERAKMSWSVGALLLPQSGRRDSLCNACIHSESCRASFCVLGRVPAQTLVLAKSSHMSRIQGGVPNSRHLFLQMFFCLHEHAVFHISAMHHAAISR